MAPVAAAEVVPVGAALAPVEVVPAEAALAPVAAAEALLVGEAEEVAAMTLPRSQLEPGQQ